MTAGLGAVAALLAAVMAGLGLGPAGIPPDAVLGDVLSRLPLVDAGRPLSRLDATVLWELRAPRVALGAAVGAMLAAAGGAYQAVFRNPLADPYLLGVAAGAGLGATAVIAYAGGRSQLLPPAAFAGATAAVAAAYLLGRRATATLILAGRSSGSASAGWPGGGWPRSAAGSASARCWPGRSPRRRRCCSSTSRPPRWTSAVSRRCSSWWAGCAPSAG